MLFRQVWDEKLAQYAYLMGCQKTREALIVDPQRDIDQYIRLAEREGLEIVAAADTHIHADYLSGLREFAERRVRVYASDEGDDQSRYEWLLHGAYEHVLLRDGDTFRVGSIELQAVHTPGHTPEHLAYLVTDGGSGADLPVGIVTGDFVFVGDLGRPDLLESAAGYQGVMEPSARTLFRSVQRFLEFDDYLQVWPAHGAGSACGKALGAVPQSTVGYERRCNGAILAALAGEQLFARSILEGQPEPPVYFARMKRDNRLGPGVLRSLPNPYRLSIGELRRLSGRTDIAVVDARVDRESFMAGHLKGSFCAPFNRAFNTVVGSFVEENLPIYLIIQEDHVEAAVRDLVRIGLDRIVAYATPEMLDRYRNSGGELEQLPEHPLADLAVLAGRDDTVVLDVRNATEYEAARVPGALNIAHTRLWVRRGELPAGKTLAVHCMTGERSAVSAALLKRLGHDVVFLTGDFGLWAMTNRVEVGRSTLHSA